MLGSGKTGLTKTRLLLAFRDLRVWSMTMTLKPLEVEKWGGWAHRKLRKSLGNTKSMPPASAAGVLEKTGSSVRPQMCQ